MIGHVIPLGGLIDTLLRIATILDGAQGMDECRDERVEACGGSERRRRRVLVVHKQTVGGARYPSRTESFCARANDPHGTSMVTRNSPTIAAIRSGAHDHRQEPVSDLKVDRSSRWPRRSQEQPFRGASCRPPSPAHASCRVRSTSRSPESSKP